MLSSASIQVNNTRHLNNPQDNLESQASITTNSVTDDCDFRTLDISSSAQTSTVSPHKNIINNMQKNQQIDQPDFNMNSFSFYSGPATNEKDHISRFRKSLVLSNSFNSISSVPTSDASFSELTKTIQSNEEPTKNLGMVISPSMRALSDILTSKVSLNKSTSNLQQTTICEDEEEDNVFYDYEYNGATDTETILPTHVKTQQPISLIDDVFLPQQSASSETLQINTQLDNTVQGDLIDLSSPAVSQKRYSSVSPKKYLEPSQSFNLKINLDDSNMSYNEIYESYSPTENFIKTTPTVEQKPLPENINPISKRVSNRFSTISDVNFNEFHLESPAILFNDPLETNQFIHPTLTKSLSKLTINSETINANDDGFDNDENIEIEIEDEDSKEFSFIPSRENTIVTHHNFGHVQQQMQTSNIQFEHLDSNYSQQKSSMQPASSTFAQTTPKRYSIEFVADKDDKSPFLNDYLKTININPTNYVQSNDAEITTPTALGISTILTPKLDNVATIENNDFTSPDLQFQTPKVVQVPNLTNNESLTTNVLNSSPIRNTSPTFENYKNSPTASPKRNVIKLSTPEEPSDFKNANHSNQSFVKLKPAKPKSKLTFKSFFGKSTDNLTQPDKPKKKSPLLPTSDKFQRAKSFNFTSTKDSSQTREDKNIKKEKTKSLGLLSGWKRKSLGFNKDSTKEHTTTINGSKSSNNIFSRTHLKTQSTASLPVLSSPVANANETPKSPHKHSKSTTELFSKDLPDLPPPHLKEKSLLEMYGFIEGIERKSPVFSQSPEVNFGNFDSFKDSTTVKETVSERSLENEHPPMDLPQPQSAIFAETTPVFEHKKFDTTNENITPTTDTNIVNTSSVYDSTTEAANVYDDELSFFKPPQKIGSPALDSLHHQSVNEEMLQKTPTPASPSISVVESFVQSPNKYHIGDDMFPKNLGRYEIESIVSLERSRSFRSVKSHQQNNTALNHKSSILRMVQNTNDDFDEIRLPDGMVVVKSPIIDQLSVLSRPSRKSSILKNSVSIRSPISPHNSQRMSADQKSISIKNSISYNSITSSALDDEFNDLIDLIHFGDGDSQLNTDFNIDTAVQVTMSPLRTMPRDSSVPDFLGIETSYLNTSFEDNISFKRDYKDNNTLNEVEDKDFNKAEHSSSIQVSEENEVPPTPPPHSETTQHSQFFNYDEIQSAGENEIVHDDGYYDNNLDHTYHSQIEQTLAISPSKTGPNVSINFGSSIPAFQNFNTQNYHSLENLDDKRLNVFQTPLNNASYSALKPETQSAILGSLVSQRPVDTIVQSDSDISISYAEYAHYDKYSDTRVQDGSPSKFSVNNPFTDYTQSYDDEIVLESSTGPFNSGKFERRKSLDFSKPFPETKSMHTSSLSLPTPQQSKPKTLKKKSRASVSFGSMFESLITPKETISRGVKFSSRILLYDTYGEDEYDRKPDSATCNSLTPQIAMQIKNELNALKSEMPIHEESRCYTHFF